MGAKPVSRDVQKIVEEMVTDIENVSIVIDLYIIN